MNAGHLRVLDKPVARLVAPQCAETHARTRCIASGGHARRFRKAFDLAP